jgi:glycerol kinase
MTDYILAIDQGTTSSRAIIFDTLGKRCGTGQEEFPQHFPHDGWVEHDAEDIWQSTLRSCKSALLQAGLQAQELRTIGISNQRETTLIWNRETGEPVYRAIVWQDRRTSAYCQQLQAALEADGRDQLIQEKTGLLIDPYFSATKIRWILDNVPGVAADARAGKLAFGTVDSFLLWRLTGGKRHATDATNASRTLLFNIHTQSWDDELLTLFDIPVALLPEVLDSAADFGATEADLLGAIIPINGIAGDQQAAAFGQCCFEPGMAKSTYGTGCFLLLNTGKQIIKSEHRLLTTVAYRLNGETTYALEGSIFMAGATMQWLRDGLRLFKDAAESEQLALATSRELSVLFVPAFTGLGAPYWDADARGAIFGLTRDTGIKEVVTAALLSVCYQTRDLQKAMEADGVRPTTLRVDGGMVKNEFLLQSLADLLGSRVDRPEIIETTALGVAYLAGLYCGIFDSLESVSAHWRLDKSFMPKQDKAWRDSHYADWQNAVSRTRSNISCTTETDL